MLDPNQKLFRAAIMQSGAPATLPMGRTETASQGSYDAVAQKVGCSGPNSFECIRKVDGRRLIKAAQRLTLVGTIAGDLLP
jgi:carboxylesterase type B